MKNRTVIVSCGRGTVSFSLPAHRLLGVLERRFAPGTDIKRMLKRSLDTASNSRRLVRLILGNKKVLIVVTDITRKAHLHKILPVLIARLRKIEKRCAVDVIVASGMHKSLDRRRLKELLGKRTVMSCRILQHSQKAGALVAKGTTRNGVPIVLNRCLDRYDAVLSVGVIEPHLYAGYSGGAKTVAIGLAGEATIRATHNIRFMDDAGVKIGSVRGNPFQNTLWDIAKAARLDFSVNIVNDPSGAALRVFSGNTVKVFAEGVKFAGKVFEVNVKRSSDVAVCGIGYPKDINLYQASRAINYIANTDRPVVRKGGTIVIAAELKEGAGFSDAERRFFKTLKEMRSASDLINKMRRKRCAVGEHRAYMVAKAMLDYNVIFVTETRADIMSGLPFPVFKNMESALKLADRMTGYSSKIYVIPRALSTIPKLD